MWAGSGVAQLSGADVDALRARGVREGWTFSVAETSATQYSIEELSGLVVPEDWMEMAPFTAFAQKAALPPVFDLRSYCTPVKDQAGCGSCWAFSTVGTIECAIFLGDGIIVDLSEQWLVSCNEETTPPVVLGEGTWGCDGGWFAHGYHQSTPDSCGDSGAPAL